MVKHTLKILQQISESVSQLVTVSIFYIDAEYKSQDIKGKKMPEMNSSLLL